MEKENLADIVEALKYDNSVVQAMGFSQLTENLTMRSSNQKEIQNVKKVFYDCLYLYGFQPYQWFFSSLPNLLKNEIITKEELLKEIHIRLTEIKDLGILLKFFIEKCKLSIIEFLQIVRKVDSKCLLDLFSDADFVKKNTLYASVLMFTNILDSISKQKINFHSTMKTKFSNYFDDLLATQDKMEKNPECLLNYSSFDNLLNESFKKIDKFQIISLLRKKPSILFNKNFENDIIFHADIIHIMQTELILKKSEPSFSPIEFRTKFSNLIVSAENPSLRSVPKNIDRFSMESIFDFIINHQKIELFIDFVNHYLKYQHFENNEETILSFVANFLHYCESDLQKKVCDLIVKLCQKQPHLAGIYVDQFFVFFKNKNIEKSILIETLTDLALNRFVTASIVKFLCQLTTSQINEKSQVYSCLERIVKKYPTIYTQILPVVTSISTDDNQNIFNSKLKLIKTICISTDDCDELLSILSKLLKENGSKLAATLKIIQELCQNDVLEIRTIKKQLSKKLEIIVENEDILIEYCQLLKLGSTPDSEESDERNLETRLECIQELYSYTKHKSDNVAAEAWRSLGNYDILEIEEALKIATVDLINIFINIKTKERIGFADFLKSLIDKECESYPKILYNSTQQSIDVLPLFSKIDSFKDSMNKTFEEDPSFWKSTLPLSAAIIQLTSSSNKAITAVRLIRSCANRIPTSTCHDDMIRIFASWRICIRESLNVLTESKNNDILWARDQICEEGRKCLADCSESVDHVMIILTVLTNAIEEKLKNLDNSSQINQIEKSQIPWIISVFEFCASRLPKNLKIKRSSKVHPIYQIMTQSTKSSLHIAMFCIRLLMNNPVVVEFYQNEATKIELIEDPVFDFFFNSCSTKEIKMETKNQFWQNVEAYGIDLLTAKRLENSIILDGENQKNDSDKLDQLLNQIGTPESIQQFFNSLKLENYKVQIEYHSKSKKIIEKLWNNGDNEVKKSIYDGLSQLILTSTPNLKTKKNLINPEKLTEKSVLRNVFYLSDAKHKIDEKGIQLLVFALIQHKRKDGRYLPSLDWNRFLMKINLKEVEKDVRLNVLELACEQNMEEIIFEIVNQSLLESELVILAQHFHKIIKILPANTIASITRQFVKTAEKCENSEVTSVIIKTISQNQSNPIVKRVLINLLPKMESLKDLFNPVLNAIENPQEFVGLISNCYDFWVESRNKNAMNMKRICELFSKGVENERNYMMGILSLESALLPLKQRFKRILDVITISRIWRSSSADLTIFLPIVISLIVSPSKSVKVPIFWFDENKIQLIMCSIFHHFIENIVNCEEMKENGKIIVSFLIPYVSGVESELYEEWQKKISKDMLLRIMARHSSEVMSCVENESDDFWRNVLT